MKEPDVKTIKIEIFDPPMCCPSGLCGPAIDPELLAIGETILKFKAKYDNQIHIERYLLTQQGDKFMKNADVLALLQKEGTAVLPVTIVNAFWCRCGW
jgi:hypothetical protein